MLRSIAAGLSPVAISGHRCEASLRNYIGRPSSKQLRAYSNTLPVRRVEGHISLSSQVSRRCHREQSICSCEFDRSSFMKYRLEQFVF